MPSEVGLVAVLSALTGALFSGMISLLLLTYRAKFDRSNKLLELEHAMYWEAIRRIHGLGESLGFREGKILTGEDLVQIRNGIAALLLEAPLLAGSSEAVLALQRFSKAMSAAVDYLEMNPPANKTYPAGMLPLVEELSKAEGQLLGKIRRILREP